MFGTPDLVGAVHERRHFARQDPLRLPLLRCGDRVAPQFGDVILRQEGETAEISLNVGVVGVQPKLIKTER